MGLKELLKLKSSILILLCSHALADGYLYDELNQYFVICRLTDEKNVKPFFGEDTVKFFYTCQDKEVLVINTHSDYPCEKQTISPRGDRRDWRKK